MKNNLCITCKNNKKECSFAQGLELVDSCIKYENIDNTEKYGFKTQKYPTEILKELDYTFLGVVYNGNSKIVIEWYKEDGKCKKNGFLNFNNIYNLIKMRK